MALVTHHRAVAAGSRSRRQRMIMVAIYYTGTVRRHVNMRALETPRSAPHDRHATLNKYLGKKPTRPQSGSETIRVNEVVLQEHVQIQYQYFTFRAMYNVCAEHAVLLCSSRDEPDSSGWNQTFGLM